MPGNVQLSISVPSGTCYSTPAIDWPLLVSLITANVSGTLNLFNYGNTTPTADNRDKPWIRTNSDGTPDGVWTYANGYWLQKHEIPTSAIMLYLGTEASIDTYDNGEAGAVTTITGPFWEKVTDFNARSPMGIGTLPTSSTVVTVAGTFGEERHTMTLNELVPHTHTIQAWSSGATGGDGGHILNQPDPGTEVQKTTGSTGGTGTPVAAVAFNVVHPVVGCLFIRRTGRLYRRRAA